MTIVIDATDNRAGAIATAALHFSDGLLAGLKLIGFTIYKRDNGTIYATLPARQYTVNGDRRSFALLRATGEAPQAQQQLLDAVVQAYHADVALRAAWNSDSRPAAQGAR